MKLNHKILIYLNYINRFFAKKNNFVRILNYHNIPKEFSKNFEEQIFFLKKNYNILTPSDFEKIIFEKKCKGRNILFTFDDGYKSVNHNAIKILDKHDIKSLFFIISDFSKLTNASKAQKFIKEKIFPNHNDYNLDKDKNLSINDIKELILSGHSIGYHTKTHFNLGLTNDKKLLKNEILANLSSFENDLNGYKINHFAFPLGSPQNINNLSYKIASLNYNYLYSGVRGDNLEIIGSKKIFRRDEISPNYSIPLLKAILDGSADFFYRKKLKELDTYK